jgi:hypothetical protein
MMKFNQNLSIVVTLCFIVSSCQYDKVVCETDLTYPDGIGKTEFALLYESAKWKLYQLNATDQDSGKFYDTDGGEHSVKLTSTDMIFSHYQWRKDTISLIFFFENGVRPDGHSYYYSYSFWGSDQEWGANLFERGGIVMNDSLLNESRFVSHLRKNEDSITPWLECMMSPQ